MLVEVCVSSILSIQNAAAAGAGPCAGDRAPGGQRCAHQMW